VSDPEDYISSSMKEVGIESWGAICGADPGRSGRHQFGTQFQGTGYPTRPRRRTGNRSYRRQSGSSGDDSDFAVSQNGTTTLTLPLRFGWSGVGSAVRAALGYGDLPYQMKGQQTLELPGGLSQAVSFTHEGRVPLITRKAILSDL
jgi:hypothetical protein